MCGIVAVLSLDGRPLDPEQVRRMVATMAHRGPDGEGIVAMPWSGGSTSVDPPGVVLGHRRLAILDLSDRAAQPMRRGDVAVTFNGEIYNFVELRRELADLGRELSTGSDTEVLLESYREWGDAFVERLNGIFAFVLHDAARRRVVAVRDRLGVKPLFWTRTSGEVRFASEIRALRVGVGHTDIDEGLVHDFLLNGRLDHGEETFFAGIRRVPAGHLVVVSEGSVEVRRYWAAEASRARFGRSFEENVEEFGSLLRDAVRIEMRADVPVGCCLSGGLDSSAVVSIASELTATPITVFTARYRHREMDEWGYAQAVHAERAVTPVSVFAEAEEFWGRLDDVVAAQEEPFAAPGVFAQWRLMREIQDHGLKVVLDGQGGDELLCGYAKYFYFSLMELVRGGRAAAAARAAVSGLIQGGPQLFNLAGARRYLPGAWWLDRRREDLLQPDFRARWRERVVTHPGGSVVDQQILDLTRFGLPTLLRYEDRNSMAHGIEARVPFLDHRLVELALSVPTEHKIRGATSKRLLREALVGTLPETIRRRRSKLGFGGSWHLWVEDLAPKLAGWLESPSLKIDRFVRREAARHLLRRRDASLFHLLVLDRWLERYQSA